MTKVWQCTRVDYHTMVRPVSRCTLCGASVEERVLKESNTESSEAKLLYDMGFNYETIIKLLDDPF